MPDSPLIGSFHIGREILSGDNNDHVVINGIDPKARAYSDTEVRSGQLYRYTVTAELKFGLSEITSEPRFYRAVSDGHRPLVLFGLTSLDWNPNAGTILAWDSCEEGGTIDGTHYYAVIRSVSLEQGYNQITPIFPASACIANYIDTSAQYGRYFYSIMEFDTRTGEPVGYTNLAQFDNSTDPQVGDYIAVPAG